MVSNPFQDGLSVQIDGDSSGLESTLAGAKSQLGNFRKAALGAGVAVGALAAGGLAKAAGSAADFEDAMVEVEKVTDPETADEMGRAIQDMAGEMPIAQNELAGITEQAARLGIEGTDNLTDYTKTVGQMATATDLTADEAADSFARIGTLMDVPVEQSENMGSAMNELANTMGTSASEITDVMTRAGGSFNQLGVGADQAMALSGAMNEVSPSSRLAASGMKRMSESMMDPSNVGALAESLGVTEEEFRNMRENDPSGTLLEVADAANSSEEAANTLKSELGKTGQDFVTLGQNTDAAREGMEGANEAWEEGTGIQEEAETAASTFNSQMDIMRNKLRNIGISIGQQLLPPLTKLLEYVMAGIDRFSALNKRTDGMAGTIALLTGVMGGLLSAAALLAPMFAGIAATLMGTLVPALTATAVSIGAVTAPVWLVVGALAALGVAYQKNLFGFRDAVNSVVTRIRPALEMIVEGFRALATRIGEAISRIRTQVIAPFLAWIVPIWEEHLATIAAELSKTIGVWIDTFVRFVEFVQPYVAAFLERLSAWWGDHGDTVMAIVEPLMAGLKKLFEVYLSLITDALTAFFRLARGDFEGFKEALLSIVDTLVSAVVDYFKWLYDTLIGGSVIPEMLSSIISAVRNFDLAGAFRDAVTGALRVVKGLASDFASAGRDLASGAASAFKSAFNAAIPSSVGIDPVTVAGKEVYGGGSVSLPSLDTGGVIETGGLAQLHAGETVVPADVSRGGTGDTYDVDVTIQGDADRRDVKRGVSDALRSINAKR